MLNIEDQFLAINKYSRVGIQRDGTLGLVIHWFENPNQSAGDCRDYFEARKDGKLGFGSAQYIIGLKGEIIRTMPDGELAYHAGSDTVDPESGKVYTDKCRLMLTKRNPNYCSIGIEHAHLDWQGTMTDETYHASVQLAAELCIQYNLDPITQIFTHKELVGWKNCHKFFVNNQQAWVEYKGLVLALVKTLRS